MRILFLLMIWPVAVWADDFAALSGDTVLSRAELTEMTAGRTLEFYEGGVSHYSVGGAYSYTYPDNGGTAFGQFTVGEDEICIAYRNGRSRCDRFVRSHGRLVMLTEDGQRFAIRP